ncbi:hypothetical protein [Veronia pacifica]|uniref:MalT-like TPR region domain-containing protein n=1 Tax=Veronia pacifica TaxID=1080227 RepID=A0A1C3EBS4_9GAMM|nr:hypothetical protein [Veronia pacifica]ODA30691.1 hypothetical protein A8L45_19340 [Veronia pacifica]
MIQEFINEAWGYHADDPERVAAELEALDLEEMELSLLAPLFALSNHTVGEHLNQWPRASALAEKAAEQFDKVKLEPRHWNRLSTAAFMAGNLVRGHEAELNSMSVAGEDSVAAVIENKVFITAALVASGLVSEALSVFTVVKTLTEKRTDTHYADRSVAIATNGIASDLVELEERTPEQDQMMSEAAHLSLHSWRKCGTWINDVRGLYLLSYVENARSRHQLAIDHGLEALSVLEKNGGDDVEEAFVRLELARAYQLLADKHSAGEHLDVADTLANKWEDKGLADFYQKEKAKYF